MREEELHALIDRAGITLATLAKLLNVTPAAVSAWARGVTRIAPDRAEQLRKILGRLIRAREAARHVLEEAE